MQDEAGSGIAAKLGWGAAALAGTAAAGLAAYIVRERFIEGPEYTVLESDDAFEIRAYPTMVVAETEQMGSRSSAMDSGYRALSDYIAGREAGRAGGGGRSIRMNKPVMLEPGDMAQAWKLRFKMPRAWNEGELPQPRAGIAITRMLPRTIAALRFSGNAIADPALVTRHCDLLLEKVAERGRRASGTVEQAFYNAPFVPPFLRRNEVWVELAD